MALQEPLFQGPSQAAVKISAGAAAVKVHMGKGLPPSSFMWLMSGLSSSQVVGLRVSIPNELMSTDPSWSHNAVASFIPGSRQEKWEYEGKREE